MSEDVKLHSTMDANVWAKEFMRINPTPDLDTMRSWFANLIMCGWDHAHWKCEKELAKWKSRYEELKLENKRIREDGFKAGSQQAYDVQVREWKSLAGELVEFLIDLEEMDLLPMACARDGGEEYRDALKRLIAKARSKCLPSQATATI